MAPLEIAVWLFPFGTARGLDEKSICIGSHSVSYPDIAERLVYLECLEKCNKCSKISFTLIRGFYSSWKHGRHSFCSDTIRSSSWLLVLRGLNHARFRIYLCWHYQTWAHCSKRIMDFPFEFHWKLFNSKLRSIRDFLGIFWREFSEFFRFKVFILI